MEGDDDMVPPPRLLRPAPSPPPCHLLRRPPRGAAQVLGTSGVSLLPFQSLGTKTPLLQGGGLETPCLAENQIV